MFTEEQLKQLRQLLEANNETLRSEIRVEIKAGGDAIRKDLRAEIKAGNDRVIEELSRAMAEGFNETWQKMDEDRKEAKKLEQRVERVEGKLGITHHN